MPKACIYEGFRHLFLSIGPSLNLFVEKVIAGLRKIYTEHFIRMILK